MEEKMRDLWLGILSALFLAGAPQAAWAGEFLGMLERVDRDTVTLRGPDNRTLVVRVDTGKRRSAAPFIGKTVTVQFSDENGGCRAVGFRSAR